MLCLWWKCMHNPSWKCNVNTYFHILWSIKTTFVSPTIICHIMMCLLHVVASTGPSTRRSPTKKTAVADSVNAYVEPKIQYFQIKLLKILRWRLITNVFHIKLSVIADKHLYEYVIFILGELSLCCQYVLMQW